MKQKTAWRRNFARLPITGQRPKNRDAHHDRQFHRPAVRGGKAALKP